MANVVGVVDRIESESGMQNGMFQPGIGRGMYAVNALAQAEISHDAAPAQAYPSVATNFNISQVVNVRKGVDATIRVADCD